MDPKTVERLLLEVVQTHRLFRTAGRITFGSLPNR